MKRQRYTERIRQGGFSLVEILVAAAILGIAIAAVFAVVRKGRELQVSDNYRRQAKAVIEGILEQRYDDRSYLTTTAGTDTSSVGLGVRGGAPLIAVVREVVSEETDVGVIGGYQVPTRQISITVSWVEPDAAADSVSITKWITAVRPPGPSP